MLVAWALDVAEAATFQTIGGEVVIDAEQYTRLGGSVGGTWFVNTQKTGFIGSGYIESAKDDPGTLTFSGKTIRAEYDIDFKTAGTYYVHLRSYAEDHTQNGFFASVNGVQVSYGDPAATYVYAHWKNKWWWYTDGGGAGVRGYMVSFNVSSPGKKTFAVVRRDKGSRIDQIWLTQNRSTPVDAAVINRPAPSNFIVNENIDGDNDGFTIAQGDCNDGNAGINPGAVEICGDSIDQDCSGADLLCGGASQEFSFDAGSEGFSYRDDLFRGTSRPAYASGIYAGTVGYAGGGLQVTVGNVDNTWLTTGMSGGWSIPFTVNEAGPVTIDLRYRLTIAGEYEADEYSQVLASVDGTLIGAGGKDYLLELRETDIDGPAQDSGWRTATITVTLSKGTHTLAVGAWNNKKTGALEVTHVYFDDIVISQSTSSPDADGDGYTVAEGDCNDANASINPGATEICGDGIDQDCSGADLPCGGDSQVFNFDASSQGFSYRDDLFRGTRRPDYASGTYDGAGGYTGGGLRVTVGGLDFTSISDGMSGGWSTSFTVNAAGPVSISLRYRLIIAGEYESDEYSQALASVDGTLIGTGGNDYLIELRETDVNGPVQDSGWRIATLQVTLSEGTHTLAVGAWNNKKTGALEVTNAYFDDIVISQSSSSPDADGDGYTVGQGDCNDANASVNPGAVETCDDNIDNDCDGLIDCLDDSCDAFCGGIREEFGFNANSEGFVYNDDLFRGTSRPAYASGSYVGTGGYTGGGLRVTLGDIDGVSVTNGMSGGWSISFEVLAGGPVNISLRYRLTIAGEYEADEYSQVLASVDGALIGAGGGDFIYELRGTDVDTPIQDSGWRTATLQLTLGQGLHTLTVGAWNNKKTGALEVTQAYFDDIVISHSDSSTLLLFENFSSPDLSRWSVVDESIARPSDWRIVNGRYSQLSARVDEWEKNYHLGSYAYYSQGFGFDDYSVRLKMTSLASAFGPRDSMGILFRYQNGNNYYRYLISRMQGIRRLEKKTNGVFTTLAFDGRGFSIGQEMTVTVVIDGPEMIVYENGEILFSARDTDHAAGSIALFTQGPTAFDDIEVSLPASSPRLAISQPGAFTIASTDDTAGPYEMDGAATVMNLLSGYGVKFIKDAGMTSMEDCLDYSPPYDTAGCAFGGVLSGDHSLSAMIVDGTGQAISDSAGLDGDANGKIGFGGKYIALFGDSISNGVGDDNTADNNSSDGRNLNRGLSPMLNNQLSGTFGVPVTVYNEGLGGTTSVQGLSRIGSTIDVHSKAQLWLVLFGTNDSAGTLPLMSGVGCTATDFASGNIECIDTYKHYMSRIVDSIQAGGHTPFLAKVPFVKDVSIARDQLIQEYNACIDELTAERGLPDPSPDFYTFFKQNPGLYFDEIHPNGSGYREMAAIWHDAIVGTGILERP
ncbi:MopE-related protein [Desulfococcus sp.]|uniref:MopE-related protein n=1 Tax=Desulfococcus sp. TaxID=2025834 RepID=UPI0035938F22